MRCDKIDRFCYVCGHYMPSNQRWLQTQKRKNQKSNFTDEFKRAYTAYFFDQPDLTDADYTPNFVCHTCSENLRQWMNEKRKRMPFGTPMIWLDFKNGHDEDVCYACRNLEEGKKNKIEKEYVSTFTGAIPQPSVGDPPLPPKNIESTSTATGTSYPDAAEYSDAGDMNYVPMQTNNEPEFVTQRQADHLVAYLGLSQRQAEYFASWMKNKNLTDHRFNSTAYRRRQKKYQHFYALDETRTVTYCNDIRGLMGAMDIQYNGDDWRLFIDGSSSSLKAVLLHISKEVPAIALYYSTSKKEDRESLTNLLYLIKYNEFRWKICADLKVINILMGVKAGYPNYGCFKCDWHARQKDHDHYSYDGWKGSNPDLVGEPLVPMENILMPPLHIKLGLVQKFIKQAIIDSDAVFNCLKTMFKGLSDAKIKGGIS